MARKLEGKVALITGGTTGIGLATARLFHDEGARVLVTGSTAKSVETARVELRGIAEVVQSDAGDAKEVAELFERVKGGFGGLDVLFLNAGIVRSAPFVALAESDFDEIFRINVKGPWLAIRAAIPVIRHGGSIVLNGSISGRVGWVGNSIYGSSKAAVRSLARTAASELAEQGVRVNVVSPGPTDSGIIAKMGVSTDVKATIEQALMAKIPLRRLGTTLEIAKAALFLASGDSSFMTGEEIMVDGGLTTT